MPQRGERQRGAQGAQQHGRTHDLDRHLGSQNVDVLHARLDDLVLVRVVGAVKAGGVPGSNAAIQVRLQTEGGCV